jgi:PAS domain S-box-containing protein
LHSVLETATDGVILLDSTGRILHLNRSAEALFGFDQNEIAGESITILLEPESHIAALDYLEGLKSHGVSSLLNDGRDVRGRERNGGIIPLFMTIGRVGDGQGSTKFCAVLRDITHWKKVEADLTDAKRAAEDSSAHKTDFLARISHEIRTPLNAIIGFSQVMMSESFGPLGNDRYKQYVKDINASGEHVVSLVNDLLDLSKVASGKLDLSFGSVDLNALVSACVSMIQPQANAGKVIVRSQLAASLPPVVADDRSIRQILLNLLSNAAKYTEAGGQVVASTSLTERGEVTIRVRDTGIGMTPEDVKTAMEPFRQIPGPRSSGGTGLGLPLTKALVEANRAAFTIQSDPGRGTLVEVTFPSTRVLAE